MFPRHASHWILGTAMAASVVYFVSIATSEAVADAFEPDLESWDGLS